MNFQRHQGVATLLAADTGYATMKTQIKIIKILLAIWFAGSGIGWWMHDPTARSPLPIHFGWYPPMIITLAMLSASAVADLLTWYVQRWNRLALRRGWTQ